MIFKNGKEIVEVYRGKKEIFEIYRGKTIIWQMIRSCFGNGYWINDRPWLNTDGWKN
jgi:hypothetical protein